jgi:hypothetical protein
MRIALALGVAFTAVTLAADAHPNHSRVAIRHHGGPAANVDADSDGWVTRAEASAAADRIFDDLDGNDDGRLTGEDHQGRGHEFEMRLDGPGHAGDGEHGANCTSTTEPADAAEGQEQRVTVICRHSGGDGERDVTILREGSDEHVERSVEREVTVIHGGSWTSQDGAAPTPPVPPTPPTPPMFIMLFANSEESDLNGDGALSREEFRAQHMRFFDASDANGDGRIRYERPPAPPTPPTPPAPPAPPTPPRR